MFKLFIILLFYLVQIRDIVVDVINYRGLLFIKFHTALTSQFTDRVT